MLSAPRHALAVLAATLACAAAASSGPAPHDASDWTRVLLSQAKFPEAKCLDGSPGGFYYRKGTSDKWMIFAEGGGWCSSPTNCLQRANSSLGSSTFWPEKYGGGEGVAMYNMTLFRDFHVVYAKYCDGGSWTGDSQQTVEGKVVYYKGRPLLDALLDTVLDLGMSSASELVWSGCSAGGLTAYIHLDYVRSRAPATTKVVGLAEAMFSVIYNSFAGVPTFPQRMQWGYQTWNNSKSMNAACVSHFGPTDAWQCMFGSVVVNFVQTPIFILNSHYDTWQEKAILGLNCTMPKCTGAELDYFVKYGDHMRDLLHAVPPRHAAFLTNCPAHCELASPSIFSRTVSGTSIADAITAWYPKAIAATGDPSSFVAPRWVSACDKVPCGADQC